MTREDLRAKGDVDLFERLAATPEVRAAIAERAQRDALGARRQLLGTALRLTPSMAPELLGTVEHCRAVLEVAQRVETYVYPSADFNAAAVHSEGELLFIMLSSSLLEAFEPDELRFVIGHELGHHVFAHHAIPTALLLGGAQPPAAGLALELYAWQRYAEISSDRAGLACAGQLAPVASGLFKLASGLRGGRVKIDIEAFLEQMGDLREESARLASADERTRSDWFSTHPFSPLRVRAAQLFAASEVMQQGGLARAELEQRVDELMQVMRPSYLSERSEPAERLRRLLFAGAVLVARSSNRAIRAPERAVLERLFGAESVPAELDATGLEADLDDRIAAVNEQVPELRRAQLVRDLVVVARAEGQASERELAIIRRIAAAIGVHESVIAQALEASVEPHTPSQSVLTAQAR